MTQEIPTEFYVAFLDRTFEIKAASHGTRGGEQLVGDGQVEGG